MNKYGRNWERVDKMPLTSNDWLVVEIGGDQIWFDDTSGLLTLRDGKFSPIWYQCVYNE